MAVEDFGTTPETFDFDAWIEQGTRPQRTVKVYRDWALMDELAQLEAQIDAAAQVEDPSLADVGVEELQEQYQAVIDQLLESAMSVTVRALTAQEVATISAGVPEEEYVYTDSKGQEQRRFRSDRVAVGDALLAEATVSPKLDREQVRRLRETLGDGPTAVLYSTVTELLSAGKDLPSIPFSRGRSDDSQE